MSAVNNALRSIITGKNNFCCLCLSSEEEETISIDDNVILYINNTVRDMDIADVLRTVLGDEYIDYITIFNKMCKRCIKCAISCYTFKETRKQNMDRLTRIIEGIADSFEYTTELPDMMSLYVSLNVNDLTSQHFYDMKKTVSSRKAALRRFCALDNNLEVKEERTDIQNTDEMLQEISRQETFERTFTVPLNEILLNDTDSNVRCRECYREFSSILTLKNHYYRIHAPKVFQCSICPKKYGSPSHLNAHKMECHSSLICSECGKVFRKRSSLKMHELGHNLCVVCQDCGRVYKNNETFKKHIDLNVCGRETRAHPSEAQFTCDYCNKKYTQKVSLRVHIQHEHGNYKSHDCEWCGKKFWAPSRLKAHIVKHTGEKKYNCALCSRNFVTKESLLYHTRTHTGEKPYKCQYCDSRFLSASRRTSHIKAHHKGGTYKCDVCHSKFSSRMFLQKHKRSHNKRRVDSEIVRNVNEKYELKLNNTDKNVWKAQNADFLNKIMIKGEEQKNSIFMSIDIGTFKI